MGIKANDPRTELKKQGKKRNTGYRLLLYIKPYWKQLFAAILAMALVALINLAYPYLIGDYLIDRVLVAGGNFGLLHLIVVGGILLAFIKGVFSYFHQYLTSYLGHKVVTNLRNEVFQHLQRLSVGFYESQRTGELVARITNDVGQIQTAVSTGLASLVAQFFLLLGILIAVFLINWRLTLLTITVFPLLILVVSKTGRKIRGVSHRVQEKIADLTSVFQETFSAIRVVKAFSMEKHEAKRFSKENEASFQASMKTARALAFLTPTVEVLYVLGLVIVLWYGGMEVFQGRLTTGRLLTFFTYIAMLGAPLTNLTIIFNSFQQALAGADRLFAVLDYEGEQQDVPGAYSLPPITGEVEFRNVSFGYQQGKEILSQINLKVAPGEIIALVGPSGGGKTSLINLIPRFYNPTHGEILIDGHNIAQVKAASLRQQIGLVPQETILFGVSIKENISYGKPGASDEEIIAAAKMANAHDFIIRLPQGYDTLVGERGSNLSGGQKQRVAIARALLRDPKILILDEATSALDSEAERLVQDALEQLMKGRTTFIIAHRLSTVQHAHKIVVLAGGRIIEEGTHEELMQKKSLYARMYRAGIMALGNGG